MSQSQSRSDKCVVCGARADIALSLGGKEVYLCDAHWRKFVNKAITRAELEGVFNDTDVTVSGGKLVFKRKAKLPDWARDWDKLMRRVRELATR